MTGEADMTGVASGALRVLELVKEATDLRTNEPEEEIGDLSLRLVRLLWLLLLLLLRGLVCLSLAIR